MNFYIFSPGFSIWNPTNLLFTSPAGKVLIGLAPFSHGIRYMYLWKLGTWKCNFASDFSVLNNILICNCLVLVQSYIASAKRSLVEHYKICIIKIWNWNYLKLRFGPMMKDIKKNIDLVSLLGSYILDCFFEFFLTEYGHFASVAEKNRIMKKVHLIFHFFGFFR